MANRYDNFAKGQISGSHSAVTTTLALVTGQGARFAGASAAIPRKLIVWEASAFDDPADAFNDSPAKAEIMLQTARSGDNLTVVRAQEGTSGLDMTDTSKTFFVMGTVTAEAFGNIVSFANVIGFGASGDGVTDDTAAVIDAFDAVADGGTVFFPAGTYSLATWPAGGQNYAKRFRVIGEEESILVGPAGSTFLAVEEEVTLAGLLFSGWDVILDLDSVATTIERIAIDRCRSDGAVSVVEWDTPGASAVVEDLEISDSHFASSTGIVIDLQGVINSTRIRHNQILGGDKGIRIGNDTAADEDDWLRVLIDGNTIRGIDFASGARAIELYGRDVIVSGNIIDGVNGAGTDNYGILMKVRRAVCRGNIVKGIAGATTNYGIGGLGSDRADVLSDVAGWAQLIRDNIIDMAGEDVGIFIGVEDAIVAGNHVEECAAAGIRTHGEDVQNARVQISGNNLKGGGASSVGIDLQNATDHIQVRDNIVEDHAVAIHYRPTRSAPAAWAPKDIQIRGNTLRDGAVGTHGIRMNPDTTNVTGTHTRIQIKDNYVEGMSTRWLSFDAGTYSVVWLDGNMVNGNGSSDAVLYTVTPTLLLAVDDGPILGVWHLGGSAWNGQHVVMGIYHLWVDGTGDLRIKNSAPTSDTDGTVVGTQT